MSPAGGQDEGTQRWDGDKAIPVGITGNPSMPNTSVPGSAVGTGGTQG